MKILAFDLDARGAKEMWQTGHFLQRVEFASECWIWRSSLDKDGYGRYTDEERRGVRAHRWSYEHFVAPIPDGLVLDHLCGVRACVNPAHLEPVTVQENHRRAYAKVTHCKQGHPFDAENTHIAPNGVRVCRACKRETARRIYQANPEKQRQRQRQRRARNQAVAR